MTHESHVSFYPKGERTADIPMTTAGAGQPTTAMVPVGFYDAQAIRERRGEAPSIAGHNSGWCSVIPTSTAATSK